MNAQIEKYKKVVLAFKMAFDNYDDEFKDCLKTPQESCVLNNLCKCAIELNIKYIPLPKAMKLRLSNIGFDNFLKALQISSVSNLFNGVKGDREVDGRNYYSIICDTEAEIKIILGILEDNELESYLKQFD